MYYYLKSVTKEPLDYIKANEVLLITRKLSLISYYQGLGLSDVRYLGCKSLFSNIHCCSD